MDKYTILVTGKNTVLHDDIFNRFSLEYTLLTTSMRYEDMENHINVIHPDILLIGLNAETKDELTRFQELSRRITKSDLQVVIVGTAEECEEFQNASGNLAHLVILKPTTISLIREQLEEHMRDFEKVKEEEKLAQEQAYAKALEEAESQRRKHVLVVDDDPLMLKLIKEHLHEQYDVATAISGKVALKFLESKVTDIILLDYEMPEMSGSDVLQRIRENPLTDTLPVVFLTGVTDKSKIAKVLSQKPQGYLLKPVDKDRLLETIKNLA